MTTDKHPQSGRFVPSPHQVRYEPAPRSPSVPAGTPGTGRPVNPAPPRPKGK
jgi:hypothetical protein